MDFVVKNLTTAASRWSRLPPRYGIGVRTFIVSHDGVVYEKDLGPKTLTEFQRMERFNPDPSWTPVVGGWREVNASTRPAQYHEFMLTREQAWDIVCEFTKSEGLRKHALAVETCVVAYASKLGEDEQKWSVTALLHDFDWEIHPQLPDHPMLGEPILAERGVDEEIRRAILSHADFSGVPRVSPLEKVLYACDELAGFITAISYVKPTRSVFEVDVAR